MSDWKWPGLVHCFYKHTKRCPYKVVLVVLSINILFHGLYSCRIATKLALVEKIIIRVSILLFDP